MLRNLVKYDFKWIMKNIIIFISLGLFFAIIGRLLGLIENSLVFNVMSSICKGASLSMLISAVINVLIRTWVRTIVNVYKDEGYLTNTLPVKKTLHIDSKIITLCITLIASILATFFGLLIMYYNKGTVEFIKNLFVMLENILNSSIVILIICVIMLIILQFIFIGLCGLTGIIYGYSYNDKKLVKSLLFGIGGYLSFNVITLLLFLLLSTFNDGIKSMLFNSTTKLQYSSIMTMIICGIGLYVVYIIILYILGRKKIIKGINID